LNLSFIIFAHNRRAPEPAIKQVVALSKKNDIRRRFVHVQPGFNSRLDMAIPLAR
jgi:hypothetical protein